MAHDRYREQFDKHMREVDELAQVVLKGHLILEEGLTRIIKLHVWNEEHIDEASLSFYKKVQIARSFALRKNKFGMWDLILAINSLRNELAHSLDSPGRTKKLEALKRLYSRETEGMESAKALEELSDHEFVYVACSFSAGFLARYEEDAEAFRSLVGSMDKALNPGKGGNG